MPLIPAFERGEPPPVCPWCQELFIIVHVIITCPGIQSTRNQFVTAGSLSRPIPLATIFKILKMVVLYPLMDSGLSF